MSLSCSRIIFTSGAQTFSDAFCCFALVVVGLIMPIPPRQVGRARSARKPADGVGWPVRTGIRTCDITVSSDWKMSSEKQVDILIVYTHREINTCVRAAKAACGWIFVCLVRHSTSPIHYLIFWLNDCSASSVGTR